jgi:hypothetical protein
MVCGRGPRRLRQELRTTPSPRPQTLCRAACAVFGRGVVAAHGLDQHVQAHQGGGGWPGLAVVDQQLADHDLAAGVERARRVTPGAKRSLNTITPGTAVSSASHSSSNRCWCLAGSLQAARRTSQAASQGTPSSRSFWRSGTSSFSAKRKTAPRKPSAVQSKLLTMLRPEGRASSSNAASCVPGGCSVRPSGGQAYVGWLWGRDSRDVTCSPICCPSFSPPPLAIPIQVPRRL